jgi:flavin-dependent dehydrogenase
VSRLRDAVVVGGGPAGLAFAAAASARGLDVTLLEARSLPVDKACGEGLLPPALRALEALGADRHLPPGEGARFRELRWVEEDGTVAALALPAPGGLGLRRTALSAALLARARETGAEIVTGAPVTAHAREGDRVVVSAGDLRLEARLLVAADGLGSPVRRRAGLDRPRPGPIRFGVRRHYRIAPWAEAVEVHFGRGVEAYVTPAGPRRVGVAFLYERGGEARHDALLARFPALAARLGDAEPETVARGAGPFGRAATAVVDDRLALLGDAAGYLDAVTGEGLSIALAGAIELAELLPQVLARGASRAALAPWERAWEKRFRPYLRWTRLVLALTRRPALRRRLVAAAAARPAPFERLVAAAVG